jgi:hypothetical protein
LGFQGIFFGQIQNRGSCLLESFQIETNLWFWVFEKIQTTNGFHERIGQQRTGGLG